MSRERIRSDGSNPTTLARYLMSAAQGAKMTGVAESTWWEWARTIPDFPKSIRISARCTRWDKAEIEAWLESRRAA